VTGAVFTVNTIMVGLGQGLVVRGMTGVIRWRILVLANVVFAASFLGMLSASAMSVPLAVAVVLGSGVVYTVGELIGGPVTAALAAEAAPEHLRGRYLSMVQLAWNLASTVTPVGFAWLLARGAAPIWLALTGVALAGALVAALLGRAMPLAASPVTNRAADEPVEPLEV
jgi:MFS family permease